MNLIALKNYLQTTKSASLLELTRHFNVPPSMLQDMLRLWIRKGKVCCQRKKPACGQTCKACNPLATELYLWIDKPS